MSTTTSQVRYVQPRVNISEDDHAFTIEAEMPGVSPERVSMEVGDGELTIIGELNGARADGSVRMRERASAPYRRSFALGRTINAGEISARMADGVLTVTLPKIEDVKPRVIKIN